MSIIKTDKGMKTLASIVTKDVTSKLTMSSKEISYQCTCANS